ncbi:Uncharacterised protein [Mycobacteroides abscessus subsp. bolletii]|nr:Uncharacterised protein [Mycobacteroides abscessus subsp. bolletii]SKT76518.1 Uncharacterised protein [Mycobacteroides abscessus subsp. bolletii]SLD34918.1 Uncharacterised protein [Mycobacteroides abscessus subsp. bolletii]SLF79863.1 Uncharacterised protein [Mycobacteroides abscessus subsp. bolletii]
MKHRQDALRKKNVILREPPLLNTFVHGWTPLGLFRETHFTAPNGRENTYRDEAVDDWTLGRRTAVVTYYGDRFVRFFDRGGWGEWENVS